MIYKKGVYMNKKLIKAYSFMIIAVLLMVSAGCNYNGMTGEETMTTIDVGVSDNGTIVETQKTTIPTEETEQTPTDGIDETEPETPTEIPTESEPTIEDKPLFYLSDYERWVAECMVMGESGNQPYDGQVLVAQCILNACLKDGLQPSQVRIRYQYSGWHESPSDSVKKAVSAVFDDGYKVTEEFILYFYAPKYASGSWHETQRFVIQIGGHRFFAEWDD